MILLNILVGIILQPLIKTEEENELALKLIHYYHFIFENSSILEEEYLMAEVLIYFVEKFEQRYWS